MPELVPIHSEEMSERELSFLRAKEEKERKQFMRVVRILLAFCFVIPFVFAWYRAYIGAPNPFSYLYYFGGVVFLLLFAGSCIYFNWRVTLFKLQHDLHTHCKTIEQAHITRKQYMPQNNEYFFYLNSPNRLSIEVAREDYERLEIGDEVNIEYTARAKMYLGYF